MKTAAMQDSYNELLPLDDYDKARYQAWGTLACVNDALEAIYWTTVLDNNGDAVVEPMNSEAVY